MFYMDDPSVRMNRKQDSEYNNITHRYPATLGDGHGHSFIQFKAVKKTPLQHTSKSQKQSQNLAGLDGSSLTASTVNLYVPEGIGVSQNVQYRADSSRIGGAILNEETGDLSAAFGAAMGGLGANVASAIAKIGDGLVGSDGLAQQAVLGVAGNAGQYQLLEGINFRSFQFNYKFSPKSKTEADSIKNIIKTFRAAMTPEIDRTYMVFKLTNTFEITYYVNGRADTLHKFKPSVLTQCDVVYGEGGEFGIHSDGNPAQTSMNLNFTEVELVDKKAIEEGY